MNKQEQLNQIAKNVAVCTKCKLCETALNPVPGEGNPNASLVFIGEAPGANEDETGRPFVGRAGKLLERLLQEIGMTREDVWIGNIVKHRPPENRDPTKDEIKACKPYLDLQLQIINPVLVVTLGRYAMNHFYPEGVIGRDKGHPIKLDHLTIYPVYHPAAALRSPTFARSLLEDFKRIPSLLESAKKEENALSNPDNTNSDQLGLGI